MFLLAHYSPAKGCFSSRLWQLEENVRRQNKKPFFVDGGDKARNFTGRFCTLQYNGMKERHSIYTVLATPAGFEPATCPLGGGCSIQLSHEVIRKSLRTSTGNEGMVWCPEEDSFIDR